MMTIEQWFAANETALSAMTTMDVVRAWEAHTRAVVPVPPWMFRYEPVAVFTLDGLRWTDMRAYGLAVPLTLYRRCA